MPWYQPPKKPISPRAVASAKAMRRQLTEPERRLWWHLRHRLPIEQTHFRRQVAIGPYVADFCCLSARLIVEVDGNQHGFAKAIAHDEQRDAFLSRQGFCVLRFSNFDVMRGIDGVLETIHAALQAQQPPPPTPSPQGGGEKRTP
jgi:very-short-patch-repair endonuclease